MNTFLRKSSFENRHIASSGISISIYNPVISCTLINIDHFDVKIKFCLSNFLSAWPFGLPFCLSAYPLSCMSVYLSIYFCLSLCFMGLSLSLPLPEPCSVCGCLSLCVSVSLSLCLRLMSLDIHQSNLVYWLPPSSRKRCCTISRPCIVVPVIGGKSVAIVWSQSINSSTRKSSNVQRVVGLQKKTNLIFRSFLL